MNVVDDFENFPKLGEFWAGFRSGVILGLLHSSTPTPANFLLRYSDSFSYSYSNLLAQKCLKNSFSPLDFVSALLPIFQNKVEASPELVTFYFT
jgi:hypothetical protein